MIFMTIYLDVLQAFVDDSALPYITISVEELYYNMQFKIKCFEKCIF